MGYPRLFALIDTAPDGDVCYPAGGGTAVTHLCGNCRQVVEHVGEHLEDDGSYNCATVDTPYQPMPTGFWAWGALG